jgi:hypothetical protein
MIAPLRSLLPWFAIGVLTSACSSAASDGSNAPLSAAGAETIILAGPNDAWPSDPLAIEAARIQGDTLVATITHGGGCRDHDYRVVASTAWMESFPVQVLARISHDAHADACRALLRRELRVSLAPLARAYREAYREASGSLVLRLTGSPNELVYKF